MASFEFRGPVVWKEDSTNGVHHVGFRGPTSVASDVIWTLPNADSTGTQALVSNGSGVMSWKPLVRTLSVNYSSVGNVGTGEDDLMTYTLPGGTANTAYDRLHIHATGAVDNNSVVKTLKFYIGGTGMTLFSDTLLGKHWTFDCWIISQSGEDAVRDVTFSYMAANSLGTPVSLVYSAQIGVGTFASDSIIKFTGEATNDNNMTQLSMYIDFYPDP